MTKIALTICDADLMGSFVPANYFINGERMPMTQKSPITVQEVRMVQQNR